MSFTNDAGYTQLIFVSWKMRNEFYDWCRENHIACTYEGCTNLVDIWYIKDDSHRAWAVLKWI